MMAEGSLAVLGCSRALTVTYLGKDLVKHRHEDSGNGRGLFGWPTNPGVVKDEQRMFPNTYLGCSRALTVTLLTPGNQS